MSLSPIPLEAKGESESHSIRVSLSPIPFEAKDESESQSSRGKG